MTNVPRDAAMDVLIVQAVDYPAAPAGARAGSEKQSALRFAKSLERS
jgi:hypothetical protein